MTDGLIWFDTAGCNVGGMANYIWFMGDQSNKRCYTNTTPVLVYDDEGYDQYGYDRDGYARNGYDIDGFNK